MSEPWESEPAYLGSGLLEQRTLPHSPESERAVLGALLLDPSLCKEAGQRLRPEDFYLERHEILFRACMDLFAKEVEPDLRTLQAHLEERDRFEQMGGIAYLASLDLDLPDLGRFSTYVEIVKERSVRRQLIEQAQRLTRAALEGDPLPEVVEAQAQALEGARRSLGGSGAGGYRPLAQVVDDAGERIEAPPDPEKDKKLVVPTGFTRLDQRVRLEVGEYWLLGGRPNQGKTPLLWQLAEHNAVSGRGVAIQSLEMSNYALAVRAISYDGEISKSNLQRRHLGEMEWRRYVESVRRLRSLPVWVDDTQDLTCSDICARLRRLKEEHPEIVLAALDYVQLVNLKGLPDVDARAPRFEKVAAMTKVFRKLARELELVFLAVGQLTRESEKLGRDPLCADLRDAGEEHADGVLLLHRPHREDDPGRLHDHGKLILGKAREGEPGSVPLKFTGWCQRFTEPTSTELEEEAAAARAKRKPKSYERD